MEKGEQDTRPEARPWTRPTKLGDREGTKSDLETRKGVGERITVGGKPPDLGVGTKGDGTSRRIGQSHNIDLLRLFEIYIL